MSSRGSYAKNGHVTADEYTTSDRVYDAQVLTGLGGRHSLPDYSNTPNAKYIKEDYYGIFREMRIYDENGTSMLEIGYHPEESLTGNREDYVLHAHVIGPNFKREMLGIVSATQNVEIYEKYRKYWEVYGI